MIQWVLVSWCRLPSLPLCPLKGGPALLLFNVYRNSSSNPTFNSEAFSGRSCISMPWESWDIKGFLFSCSGLLREAVRPPFSILSSWVITKDLLLTSEEILHSHPPSSLHLHSEWQFTITSLCSSEINDFLSSFATPHIPEGEVPRLVCVKA